MPNSKCRCANKRFDSANLEYGNANTQSGSTKAMSGCAKANDCTAIDEPRSSTDKCGSPFAWSGSPNCAAPQCSHRRRVRNVQVMQRHE